MVVDVPGNSTTNPMTNRRRPSVSNNDSHGFNDVEANEESKRPISERFERSTTPNYDSSRSAHTTTHRSNAQQPTIQINHFEESARRLRQMVEQHSPKRKANTMPLRGSAHSRPLSANGLRGGVSKQPFASRVTPPPPSLPILQPSEPPHDRRTTRIGKESRSLPQTPNEQQGLRRQWEIRTKQLEPLNVPAEKAPTNDTASLSLEAPALGFEVAKDSSNSTPEAPSSHAYKPATNSLASDRQVPSVNNNRGSSDLPSAKDLVERMIAYSRTVGNEKSSSSANPIPNPTASTSGTSLFSHLRPQSATDVLAPSPILNDKPSTGQKKRANISMHTDLNSLKWNQPNKTAPIRSQPLPHPLARKPRFSRTPTQESFNSSGQTTESPKFPPSDTQTYEHRTPISASVSASASSSASASGASSDLNHNIDRSNKHPLSTRQTDNPASESHFAPYSTPFDTRSQPITSRPASQPIASQPITQVIPPSPPDTTVSRSSLQKAKLNQPWKEHQWRQFSIAIRDSLAEQNLTLSCAISFLTNMKYRLPSEMQDMTLSELVRRLIVWVNSTENLKKR